MSSDAVGRLSRGRFTSTCVLVGVPVAVARAAPEPLRARLGLGRRLVRLFGLFGSLGSVTGRDFRTRPRRPAESALCRLTPGVCPCIGWTAGVALGESSGAGQLSTCGRHLSCGKWKRVCSKRSVGEVTARPPERWSSERARPPPRRKGKLLFIFYARGVAQRPPGATLEAPLRLPRSLPTHTHPIPRLSPRASDLYAAGTFHRRVRLGMESC